RGEARADPRGPEERFRSDKCRSRPQIARGVGAVVELVDAPGLEGCAGVYAGSQRRGEALYLVQVTQGPECRLLPRELVDGVSRQPEGSAEHEGIVGRKVRVEVRPAVEETLERVLA